MNLIIHAPNVHQGGGKTLLLSLLAAAKRLTYVTALLDERLEVPENLLIDITVFRIPPTMPGRFGGEWKLKQLAGKADTVLCFGNLPPLFRLRLKVVLFIQNRYLLDKNNLENFPVKMRLRISLERLWLDIFYSHAEEIIVQTPSMLFAARKKFDRPVTVAPFFGSENVHITATPEKEQRTRALKYDFLYVATGEPHKNHDNLIEAWKLLAGEKIYPSLCLTLPAESNRKLIDKIESDKVRYGLKINNVEMIEPAELNLLYRHSAALIYPSRLESFGLPLIEAKAAGLPVIASERDYVRDVIEPDVTFDPDSQVSIARAIKRFLVLPDDKPAILTPDEFVSKLLHKMV